MIRSDHKGTDRHCQGLCCGGRGCQRFAAFGGLCGHGGLGTVAGEFPYLNEVPVLVGVLFWGRSQQIQIANIAAPRPSARVCKKACVVARKNVVILRIMYDTLNFILHTIALGLNRRGP